MKIDNRGQVIQFAEKPRGADLKAMVNQYLILVILCANYPGLVLYLIEK